MSERRLMYFRTDWCGVCHAKVPVAQEIARTLALPLEVHDMEGGDGAQLGESLRITTVPTLALVDGGRARFKLVGAMITPENAAHLASLTRRPGDEPSREAG
ncbi:MAG: Thioredoxin [Gemmatimonadetes bacterium]|nr:Thioredoxin [Gemmatimonadota bacterium]